MNDENWIFEPFILFYRHPFVPSKNLTLYVRPPSLQFLAPPLGVRICNSVKADAVRALYSRRMSIRHSLVPSPAFARTHKIVRTTYCEHDLQASPGYY
jgi:hypothetical protein